MTSATDMKRKIKQWSSIIQKKLTIISHSTYWTYKKKTYVTGIQGSGLGQAQKGGRVKSVKDIPTLPVLMDHQHQYKYGGLFERKWICADFISFVYICIAIRDPVFKSGGLGPR